MKKSEHANYAAGLFCNARTEPLFNRTPLATEFGLTRFGAKLESGVVWAALAFTLAPAQAQLVINDTLTGASSSYRWKALNGACLTAGNGTGSIPACKDLSYYSGKTLVGGATGRLPDEVGKGALRLTNGDTTSGGSNGDYQVGAVVSNFTFPTNQGLQVTFATVTYGGDNFNGTGADGISFFLSDGSKDPSVGGSGGSLGFTCSNGNPIYDGVIGAYIGIGIDEFGNFDNARDNTHTDSGSPRNGNGLRPSRITLRGAGNTAFASLSTDAATKNYYPTTLSRSDRRSAVSSTCSTGTIWNFSGRTIGTTADRGNTGIKLANNYNLIKSVALPSGVSISNQQGIDKPTRDKAVPITYDLKITQDGLMDLSYSVNGGDSQPVLRQQSITASNGALPASFRFGFTAGTGGANNVHEITCFKAAPVNATNTAAGTNVQQTSQLETGTQIYTALYHPVNSWGELLANGLLYDKTARTLTAKPVSDWNASCVLTGGPCTATNNTSNAAAQGSSNRTMLSWHPSNAVGIPFQHDKLASLQQTALSVGDTKIGDARVRYLRGDRSDEVPTIGIGGKYRRRNGLLGDIVGSSPTVVGAPDLPYEGPWLDALYPKAATAESASGAQSYKAFATANQSRQNIVYVGANDGFLHGFRSGGRDANGNLVSNTTTPNDGKEVLAFIPSIVLSNIHSATASLDYTSTLYTHNSYVDATPSTGDLYYNKAWHTWLVGGLGPGGQSSGVVTKATDTAVGTLYALDITDPSKFSESNAASLVRGEWNSTSISCAADAKCGYNLGAMYGTPLIRRLHDGNWAAIFGNGLNSYNGSAGLFIMHVNAVDGATSFRFLNTGRGATAAGAKNGIVAVTSADFDFDHVTDYVYGGDVFGNLWRFDLSSANPVDWSASTAPLFSTPNGQPITTKPIVAGIDGLGLKGQRGVIVAFGTGQQLPQSQISAPQYASGSHALYGIWDWNLAGWNKKAPSWGKVATLDGPLTVNTEALQKQDLTIDKTRSTAKLEHLTVTNKDVCWKGGTVCPGGSTKNQHLGWTVPLPTSTEQIPFNPIVKSGVLFVNTLIPGVNRVLSCQQEPTLGHSVALSLVNGGLEKSVFVGNQSATDGTVVAGVGLGLVGEGSIIKAGDDTFFGGNTGDGQQPLPRVELPLNEVGGRLTWIKRR